MKWFVMAALIAVLAGCGGKSVDNSAREELLDRHDKAAEKLDRHTGQ
ncbi:MAG: hypothetical protein JXQ97_08155 [Natronospirillum sp.]